MENIEGKSKVSKEDNWFVTVDERMLEKKGKLFVVKDCIDCLPFPTSCATPSLKDYYPEKDSKPVRLLKEKGYLALGKANMHELAFGTSSINSWTGTVQNPFKPGYSAGGSSGGSGAIVAGLPECRVALGTDTGGSVRIPASWCGVYGYKPTTSSPWAKDQDWFIESKYREVIGPLCKSLFDLIEVN